MIKIFQPPKEYFMCLKLLMNNSPSAFKFINKIIMEKLMNLFVIIFAVLKINPNFQRMLLLVWGLNRNSIYNYSQCCNVESWFAQPRLTRIHRVGTKETSLGVELEDPWWCWQRLILKLIFIWFIDTILTNVKNNNLHRCWIFFKGEK